IKVSIEDLNSRKIGQLFLGDIMVVYSAFLDKANKSRQVLRADLTDAQGMMTITLSVPAHLVERHEHKILQGNSISITNFRILPKSVYD
ncbi:hypothetical protein, partial [Actinobacillus pleuropneumoniae]